MPKKNSKFKTLMCVARPVKQIKYSRDKKIKSIDHGRSTLYKGDSFEDAYKTFILSKKDIAEIIDYQTNGRDIKVIRHLLNGFKAIHTDENTRRAYNLTELAGNSMPQEDLTLIQKMYFINTLGRNFEYMSQFGRKADVVRKNEEAYDPEIEKIFEGVNAEGFN